MLNQNYDSENDILYIKFSSTKSSFADEEFEDIIILRDTHTNQITAITILDFMHRYQLQNLSLNLLPVKIDISKIITSLQLV